MTGSYASSQRPSQPRRRSFARRALLALLLVVCFVALLAGGWLLALRHRLAATVAPLDGTLHLAGLAAPVTVRRDAMGVTFIDAANLHDLLMAQGWVTASERLWQMDMARRLPAGEGSEVLGSVVVPHDRLERLLGLRDVADRVVRTMDPDQLAQLQAYAAGVNAYIAAGKLPAEFLLLAYKPKQWEPKDTVLVALSMAQMFDERWPVKISKEQVMARLAAHGDAKLAADLYPVGSWRDHPPVPSTPGISDPQVVPQIPLDPSQRGAASTPILPASGMLAMTTGMPDCNDCLRGSNDWAVSGAHTASGKPLLANDVHPDHSIPDIWYENGLSAPGFHVTGLSIPGVPFIATGHNEHIAWGFTAMGGDTQDLYVEQVNAQGQYRAANGTWVPLQHEPETIRVRGGRDVQIDVERTDHGPILTPAIPGEKRTLSLDWSIYSPAAKNLPLYPMNIAHDWTSFRAALGTWWAPTMNAVYADDAGHIGYQGVGLIPVRSGGLQMTPITPGVTQPASQTAVQPGATLPLPAATAPAGEWTGFIPFEGMPSVLDPESGIVATANARIAPDGYPYQITLDWALPYRNERIWKWLGAHKSLTRADMLALQTDLYSESNQEVAQRLAYAVDHTPGASQRARDAANLLRSWNGVMDVNSAGAALISTFNEDFWPAVLIPKLGNDWKLYKWGLSDFVREQMVTTQPAAWLPPQFKTWNDFLAAMVEHTAKKGPANLATWHYGDIHTIQIDHPLWSHVPTIHDSDGPAPLGGDVSTVQQSSGKLGPSQRFTADFSDMDASTENIVSGQSGYPASPFARNQWPYWYGGRTFPMPFSPGAVQAATRHTLQLVP